ncbi:MAG: cyclic pyranopterin monophosphate synthase MoaC [Gammaproteobacteria bacterium]|nr:cyclic pyranopterin monophosphate synthase MoaC [Gammaproteobacteria bacterium]
MTELTHLTKSGDARMVDIAEKQVTKRVAIAEAIVTMQASTMDLIFEGSMAKGDVLAVARIAGIQAAKKTSELIPLCHPLPLSSIEVSFERDSPSALKVHATCKVTGRTGVEMEALTAVAVAGLTIYDMCKGVEKGIQIEGVRLISKTGGKSGSWQAESG